MEDAQGFLGNPSVGFLEMLVIGAIAGWIAEILTNIGQPEIEQKVRKQVAELAARFPIYESRMNASAVPARV